MRLTLPPVSLGGLLQAAAVITAIVTLATLFDGWHRLLELFSHFRLQYLLVALLLATAFALLRDWRWLFAMLVVSAVAAVPVLPWYLGGSDAVPAGSAPIKVLHANLYSANDDSDALLRLVAAEQPELIFLQELTARWQRDLAVLGASYPYGQWLPREDNFGIAVLSAVPLDIESVASPPAGFPTLLVRREVGGRPVTFVSTHPMPPLGSSGFAARNTQLAGVAALIAGIAGPRVLIGDLNTAMWGSNYRQLVANTGLRNARQGFGVLPSWPTQLPFAMIPIDHCLVSADIAVVDIRTGSRIGSDHLPLVVELAMTEPMPN